MAISYTDSVKQNVKLRASRAYQSIAEDFPAVYGSEDWTLDSKYKYCPEYHDDNVVMIDDQKSVSSKTSKIVVTQGANSEFIPFELERYYDGFDLCNTVITIHFLNKNGFDDYANPINVYYSDDKIRLGWLVDNKVTAVEGIVQFEIEAVGQNSGGERYEWRTRPSDCISVLKSISGNGPIKPDSNWVVDLIGRLQSTEAEIEELKSKIGDVPSAVVEVDPTLTQDGMAADAKAVGDRIGDLPIRKNENTGYTQIEGLPRANGTVFTKNGTTITVSTTLEDGTEVNGTLTLDDTTGYPVSYTEDGHVHTFTFTGFDDSPVSVLDQAKLPIIELSNFTDTPDENITLADSEAEGLNELANTGCGVFIMKHVNEDGSIVEILFSGTIMPDSTVGIFCANVIQNVFMITNTSGVWKQSCSSIV